VGKHFGLNSVKSLRLYLAYTKFHLIRSTTSNEDTLIVLFLALELALDRNFAERHKDTDNFNIMLSVCAKVSVCFILRELRG
jgi:hypothetical protein